MSDVLGCVVIECTLKAHRTNPFRGLEIPRIRTAPLSRSSLTGRISEVTPLREGEFTQVYRGILRIPGIKPIDIVLKTDVYAAVPRPKAFTREIDAYERKLRSFQGDSIPKCYGLYQLEDDDEVLSFLVLKYSGNPIDFNVEYPEDLKADIINKLTAIHHSGYCHGDLEDHNIVVDDDKAMFVDLEDVEPHDCQIKQVVIPDDLVPSSEDFGCKEIHHVAYMLNVWQKRIPQILRKRYLSLGDLTRTSGILALARSVPTSDRECNCESLRGSRTSDPGCREVAEMV
ncbi:hypothetical protein BDN71DRAFT_1450560 [Pleurotus eryngii]|uniref:Protein kinase domain-containing protein n=1 Tax=Pleurotus eryngii TaxID=5323 RepID=A0A9P5ZT38_PLEER|nr:hypothetical protein BDN71DRAFT_1450560 [Pleurotus eryngii]